MAITTISDEEVRLFQENGFLIVRGAIAGEELKGLQAALTDVIAYGTAQVRDDPDYRYAPAHPSGEPTLRRVEYVIDKQDACKALLGNPFLLRSVEKLIGPDLIPTEDALALKLPGEEIAVSWRRDADAGSVGDRPTVSVDCSLDATDETACDWVIPGSHRWSEERAADWLAARPREAAARAEFAPPEAVPLPMQPGDVLFRSLLLLHGSPATRVPPCVE